MKQEAVEPMLPPEIAEPAVDALSSKKHKKKKRDNKAWDTFLRNSYRTHISLSALADRKSNIMVRLNSILIGLVIAFFKMLVSYNEAAVTTGLIFLITALASLVFAAVAASPHITRNLNNDSNSLEVRQNLFFFGNYSRLDYERYRDALFSIAKEPEVIYENQIRDLYCLGKVLDKKFWLLKYSYGVFLWGLAATVLSFILTVLT